MSDTITRTYRFRVRDKHATTLNRMAYAVNAVWNFANETQRTAVARGSRWPSHFDLARLTAGTSRELGILAATIDATCKRYVRSRITARRRSLRWRGQHSLGWVPVRGQYVRLDPDGFRYGGDLYQLWQHRAVPVTAKIIDGTSFSADARGRWYLNVAVELPRPEAQPALGATVGIDLGLKSLATLSTGEAVAAPQHYRKAQQRLAMAQRARKARLVRTIAAKIANQRRDFLHNLSARLIRHHRAIYVGNVSSKRLARTSMAKSVLDAGWSSLRRFLAYKCDYAGLEYREVDERGSTQLCSECSALGGPRGREGLVVREWTCSACGVIHDRDTNAARNILRWASPAPTGTCAA